MSYESQMDVELDRQEQVSMAFDEWCVKIDNWCVRMQVYPDTKPMEIEDLFRLFWNGLSSEDFIIIYSNF